MSDTPTTQVKSIYAKLLAFQKAIKPIKKDADNPFFKSKYFDINGLLGEVKPALNDAGLIVLQPLNRKEEVFGATSKVVFSLTTQIVDPESGDMIESVMALPDNTDPQKMGSSVTYFRRYALQSLLSLEAEDDDGNIASGGNQKSVAKPLVKQAVQPFAKQMIEITKTVTNQATGEVWAEEGDTMVYDLSKANKPFRAIKEPNGSWKKRPDGNPLYLSEAEWDMIAGMQK